MSDDLVKRLRDGTGDGLRAWDWMREAADRIEELEEEVRAQRVLAVAGYEAGKERIEALERERDIANAAVVLQEGLLQTLKGLVRIEALEEAARVAEENTFGGPIVANAIRALKEKE